ncbi:MAG: hypothetical protein A2426_12710 [Candidatus Lambdaproteobacteria bacterium RIFOXYC1_FULL_56_13]|nr:MAG: hypothetical protein A2426_12710 [Candidatus Lambdaproteobacteria bacterium RIFOXYC1_FULL_56_13]
MKQLERSVEGLAEGTFVLTDKGYTSAENRFTLKILGLLDGIMRKTVRGRPLTEQEKSLNSVSSCPNIPGHRSPNKLGHLIHLTRDGAALESQPRGEGEGEPAVLQADQRNVISHKELHSTHLKSLPPPTPMLNRNLY